MLDQMTAMRGWMWVAMLVLLTAMVAIGAPIRAPNLRQCHLASPSMFSNDKMDCCLPDLPVKDFEFPPQTEPMRVRRSASYLDSKSIEKYNEAYARMRALPPTDPRSMEVQWKVHCAYCNAAFWQPNSHIDLTVHGSWLFHPFHRWYLYFHERILASLIDDPTFTIPFWNWDNQSTTHIPFPNTIPDYFHTMPALINLYRDPRHSAPNITNLQWGPVVGDDIVPEGTPAEEMRVLNNVILYESIVSGAALPDLFLGGRYKHGDDVPMNPSLFESVPHTSVHAWVGNQLEGMGEDMGPSYSAARDPMFFIHHANVDRLFKEWHDLGGRREYPSDPDWLNAAFLFYDEKGEAVRVTVAQCLDMSRLRYSYEPTIDAWKEDPSTPLSKSTNSKPGTRYWLSQVVAGLSSRLGFPSNRLAEVLLDIPDIESAENLKLTSSPFHSRVALPGAPSLRTTSKLQGQLEEVLVIDGIRVPSMNPVWFEIFINLPDANADTPLTATEWCGRFSNGPNLFGAQGKGDARYSISIGAKLKKLGIENQTRLVVSLVPKGRFKHQNKVQIRTIKIELR